MLAQVAHPGRTQQRVGQGMAHHVAIRMPRQARLAMEHHPTEGQERPEGHAHLARGAAVAREEDDSGNHRREDADEERHGDGLPEGRAHQEGELHVAHAHAGGIGERRGEQEAGGAEGADRPLRAGMQRRVRREHDHAGRHDDAVRDDAVLEVGRGHRHEREAEERRHRRGAGEPELPDAAGNEQRGHELHGRIPERDVGAA